jgi:hypothetical protein
MHWSKFTQAEKDIRELATRCVNDRSSDPSVATNLVLLARGLKFGQRFYLPDAAMILGETNVITEDLKATIRLPAEPTIILTEEFLREDTPETGSEFKIICRGWKITLVFSNAGAVGKRFVEERFKEDGPGRAFYVFSTSYFKSEYPRWMTEGTAAVMFLPDHGPGFQATSALSPSMQEKLRAGGLDPAKVVNEYLTDFGAALNLMVMLSLHNVKTRDIAPPEKLVRARKRRDRTPLYSYKVLVVDSEVWDSPHTSTGTGPGFRSHFRRGHIRRLWDGRRIWVRHTMVHGRLPGFVEKEYAIKPPEHE